MVSAGKILVADRDEFVLRELMILLKAQGYHVVGATDAVSATSMARKERPDVVVLDTALPGGGLAAAERIRLLPDLDLVPMVLLRPDKRPLSEEARFSTGAEVFLSKPLDTDLLLRCLRKALGSDDRAARSPRTSRYREYAESPVPGRSCVDYPLFDETTGLYNRDAFMVLAGHQIRVSNRTRKGLALMLFALSSLESIMSALGPAEADHALVETARVLKDSFRGSDIVARVGSSEFAVLALEAKAVSPDLLMKRFYENLRRLRTELGGRYRLAVTAGMARYDPLHPLTLPEMLKEVRESMAQEAEA